MSECPTCRAALGPGAACATCAASARPARRALPMPTAAQGAAPTVTAQPPAPQQYAPQGLAPQQYAPQGQPAYAPPQQYAPQQYAPQQYAPQQCAPQQYAPQPLHGHGGAPYPATMPGQPTGPAPWGAAPAWGTPSFVGAPAAGPPDLAATARRVVQQCLSAEAGWGGLQKRVWTGLGAVALVLVMAAGGDESHTIIGRQEVHDDSAYRMADGTGCDTKNGYADIGEYADVVLEDEYGDVVGTTFLRGGVIEGDACVFTFTLTDVPDSSSYSLRVADRNAVTFSRSEMTDSDWQPVLTIGD